MGLQVRTVSNAVAGIQHELEKHGHDAQSPAFQHAKRALRGFLQNDEPLQKAYDLVVDGIDRIIRKSRAVAKSEAQAVEDAVSNDFTIPMAPSPAQAAAAATEALQVLGLRQAIGRRVQAMDPGMATEDVEAVVNLAIIRYEGQDGITVDNSNPQVAASLRERGDGTIWEPTDMADPRQRDMVDSLRDEVDGPFGTRNGFYMNPTRSPELSGVATGFSGTGGTSVPAGTSEGATVAQLSAAALQAAYAAGVSAGSNSVAKNLRMRDIARSRRR